MNSVEKENLSEIFSFNLFKSSRKISFNALQHFQQSCYLIIHTNRCGISVVHSTQYAKIGLIGGSIRGCFSSQFLFEIQIFPPICTSFHRGIVYLCHGLILFSPLSILSHLIALVAVKTSIKKTAQNLCFENNFKSSQIIPKVIWKSV